MKKLIFIALLIFLTGCTTGYHKLEPFSGGYENMKLNDNMYCVEYHSNVWTSHSKNEHYALRRAAELSIEKGYRYFIISNSKDLSSLYKTPVVSDTTMSPYSASTVISGGHTIVSPGIRLIILMSHTNSPGSFDAKAILSNYPIESEEPYPTSESRLKRVVGI